MLQLLVGGGCGHQKTFAVAIFTIDNQYFDILLGMFLAFYLPSSQTADDSRSSDRSTTYGYYVLQLGFEDAVEVFRGADGDDGVCVGEGGENADSVS